MDPSYSGEEMRRFHREIDGLNWQFGGEKMRYNFLHRSEFLPHAVVARGETILPLESAPRDDLAAFVVDSRYGRLALEEYVRQAPVNGVILLQHGKIVFERYPRMRPYDRHLLMSVSKVLTSLVLAQLEACGLVDPTKPVDTYLPELAGSGWAGVAIQDVLDMASGINAPEEEEGFSNLNHPYYQYEASLGWLPASAQTLASTYQYMARLQRKDPPGQRYEYTSVNTFVLGWLVERITGLPLHEALSRGIWSRIGVESDALLSISPFGAPAAHAGLCATLRDVARFGLLFTNGEAHRGEEVKNPTPGPSPFGGGEESFLEKFCFPWKQNFSNPLDLFPPPSRFATPEGGREGGWGGRFFPAYLAKLQGGGRAELFDRGPTGPAILQRLHGEHPRHNVNQWDYVLPDGDLFKSGYGGQGLYVSPSRQLVAAFFGTPFDEQMQEHELEWIIRQVVKAGLL
jgi:CubicO group peptidase (beta-lactamase class C family)